jgi:hypothetical protein
LISLEQNYLQLIGVLLLEPSSQDLSGKALKLERRNLYYRSTDKQTDRRSRHTMQIDTLRQRQIDRHSDRQTDKYIDRQTKRDRRTDTHTDQNADRHIDRQTLRQTDGPTDRQTDSRQTKQINYTTHKVK